MKKRDRDCDNNDNNLSTNKENISKKNLKTPTIFNFISINTEQPNIVNQSLTVDNKGGSNNKLVSKNINNTRESLSSYQNCRSEEDYGSDDELVDIFNNLRCSDDVIPTGRSTNLFAALDDSSV